MKRKILVIDDEEVISFLVKKSLEITGKFEVTATTNAEEGIEIAKDETTKPDLILLDIMMPGVSGVEVAKSLRSDPLTANIPIIFLTGIIGEEEMGDEPVKTWEGFGGFARGYFVSKTADSEKLTAAINKMLGEEDAES